MFKKVKTTVSLTYDISDLNGEEVFRTFYQEELQKISPTEFRVEKVFKRKIGRLYVKLKNYDNSFNSCINMKDII